MRTRFLLALPLCVFLFSCSKSEPGGKPEPKASTDSGCSVFSIPADSDSLHAAFHKTDDKVDYIVLTYGREDKMKPDRKSVTVDGKTAEVPADGGVYVLAKDLKLHKAKVSAQELQGVLWSGKASDLFASKAWRDELYALLMQNGWAR